MNILKKGMLVLLGLVLGVTAQAATEPSVNYVYNDHLGTPRVVVNSANKVIWQNEGEPFGNVAPQEDPDGDGVKYTLNLRFPGQYYDSESGRNQNYYRDYNPQTGRYVQSDPIGLGGGINTYGYVEGDAIRYSDPYGLLKVYEKDGVTFHANPKGSGAPGTPVEHARFGEGGEYHYHLDSSDGPRVNAYTGEPLTPEDAKKMTKKQRGVCERLRPVERSYLKRATREVFHNNGTVVPQLQKVLRGRVARNAAGIFGVVTSNSYEEVCARDYFEELVDVCE